MDPVPRARHAIDGSDDGEDGPAAGSDITSLGVHPKVKHKAPTPGSRNSISNSRSLIRSGSRSSRGRSKDQVEVARMEAIRDAPVRLVEQCVFAPNCPVAVERPLVAAQPR